MLCVWGPRAGCGGPAAVRSRLGELCDSLPMRVQGAPQALPLLDRAGVNTLGALETKDDLLQIYYGLLTRM